MPPAPERQFSHIGRNPYAKPEVRNWSTEIAVVAVSASAKAREKTARRAS